VETAMDIAAMKIKDAGMVVEDDYSNIEKLIDNKTITPEEGDLLRKFNGIRNAIAHKYDRLDQEREILQGNQNSVLHGKGLRFQIAPRLPASASKHPLTLSITFK